MQAGSAKEGGKPGRRAGHSPKRGRGEAPPAGPRCNCLVGSVPPRAGAGGRRGEVRGCTQGRSRQGAPPGSFSGRAAYMRLRRRGPAPAHPRRACVAAGRAASLAVGVLKSRQAGGRAAGERIAVRTGRAAVACPQWSTLNQRPALPPSVCSPTARTRSTEGGRAQARTFCSSAVAVTNSCQAGSALRRA